MEFYVYTLARPDESVFYVGKGSGKRIRQHEWEAQRGCSCRKCNVIRKIWRNGGEVQKVIVYRTSDEQAALDYEIALIRHYGRENLVNLTDGGDGTSGLIVSEHARHAVAEANRNRIHSPLSRMKKRLANIGRVLSEETREKIRQRKIGQSASDETRAKLRESSKGRITPEIRQKGIEATTGSRRSEATRTKISEIASHRTAEWEANRRAAQRAYNEQQRHNNPAYQRMFDLLSQGIHPDDVVEMTGLSIRTVYRWKKEWGL